jgi:hypothetical protein
METSKVREYLKLILISFLFIFTNTINSRVVAHGDALAAVFVGLALSVLWFSGIQSVSKNRTFRACLCWMGGAALGQLSGIFVVKRLLGF